MKNVREQYRVYKIVCKLGVRKLPYKIAVGSSDGTYVDLKFGEVKKFIIYEAHGEQVEFLEIREIKKDNTKQCEDPACGSAGCGGHGTGCNGSTDVYNRVSVISDCRCVVCKKVGFQAQKQFEKKAISVFDVECEVQEALKKIVFYYNKVDKHESIAERK